MKTDENKICRFFAVSYLRVFVFIRG